ncbi:hypothetical protein KM043_005232 [Ampulex compressa]|nr:hypothetical protein KM043_005232 [Ampulex compressa]
MARPYVAGGGDNLAQNSPTSTAIKYVRVCARPLAAESREDDGVLTQGRRGEEYRVARGVTGAEPRWPAAKQPPWEPRDRKTRPSRPSTFSWKSTLGMAALCARRRLAESRKLMRSLNYAPRKVVRERRKLK